MATRFTTVRVFQDAVQRLADDPSDPIVDVLVDLAERIRVEALANITKLLRGSNHGVDITVEVGQDTKGMFVRVTPDGQGRLSSYLTWKEAREHSWLQPAVETVLGAGGVRGGGSGFARRLARVGPRI